MSRVSLEFGEQEGFITCVMDGLPIMGRGRSRLEAMESLVRAVPVVMDEWNSGMCYESMSDEGVLQFYHNLRLTLEGFSGEDMLALYCSPRYISE